MYGYIYLTTNLINNKKYIGQHISETFDTEYYGSGKILLQSIKKEGIENFKCEIIKECFSKDELDKEEAYYIDLYDAVNSPDYYNLKPGGLGKSVSGVVYITNGTQCKKVFPDELDYYFSLGWYKGGPKQSKETILKRANSNKGKTRSAETRKNISNSLKGRKLSPEHAAKCCLGRKGIPSYNKGKIQVNNGIDYLFVDKDAVDNYLNNGYSLGGKQHTNESNRKDKIAVHKDNDHTEYISKDELDYYLSIGYTKGAIPKKKKRQPHQWCTDGKINILIPISRSIPKGFKKGRTL